MDRLSEITGLRGAEPPAIPSRTTRPRGRCASIPVEDARKAKRDTTGLLTRRGSAFGSVPPLELTPPRRSDATPDARAEGTAVAQDRVALLQAAPLHPPLQSRVVQTHGKIPDVGEEQPVLGLVEEKVHEGLVLELLEPDLLWGMLEQVLQAVEAVERVTPRAFEGSPADSPQILRGDRPVVDLKLRAQALLELPLPAGLVS